MNPLMLLQSFVLICSLMPLLYGCAPTPSLQKITPDTAPQFTDDLQTKSILTGAVRHLHYLNTLPNDASFVLGEDTYSIAWLRESMNAFIDILKQDPNSEELGRIIRENYTIYQAAGRKGYPDGEMLITGYYEPFLDGSLSKTPPFIYPLYSPPDSLIQLHDPKTGKRSFKRKDSRGQLLPYWSRQEIEDQHIAAGKELVYLDSPVDAFILHVQGSGKIRLRDGSTRSIHYAADNGLEYFSIGKLLVDQNKLSLAEVSIPSIRAYLKDHSQEQKAILNHNSKFIFFNWAADGDPVGSIGEPLTPGRSIAIDPDSLPRQVFGFLNSRRPEFDEAGNLTGWQPLHRFVFPQDSGAAIKGNGRADLFWGNGDYAKHAAGNMKEQGTLFFLVKNSFEKNK